MHREQSGSRAHGAEEVSRAFRPKFTIVVEGLKGKEPRLKDNHVVRLAVASATLERRCPRCGADAVTVEVEVVPGRREMFCERCRPR